MTRSLDYALATASGVLLTLSFPKFGHPAFGWRGVIAAPLVWVATELGRTHLLTGFPWVLLGYSQATVLPIAQVASLFGVFGVSALVASVSAAAALTDATSAETP